MLVRVVDGDTYVLDIDLGFYVTTRQHVRLAGLDCPEAGTIEGKAATVAAIAWFATCDGRVVVETGKRQAKTFDRWVAVVRLPPEAAPGWDVNLADHLRVLGHFKATN